MIKVNRLKPLALLTLCLFLCSSLMAELPLEKEGDILLKARMLIREGDFDAAVNELTDVIEKLKLIISRKRSLAEAYYLLARVYKIVKMERQCRENLEMAFQIFPNLNLPEADPEFSLLVERIKVEQAAKRVIPKPGIKKKKKFPVLWVAAGVVAVMAVVLLLTKKKKSGDTGSYDTEVLGIQWVMIPAGEFTMGDNLNAGWIDEQPVHNVMLDTYHISRDEVTYNQYDTFCDDTGRNKPDDFGWGRDGRPVTDVSWEDANAFCLWLSQKTGKNIRLPSEAQWEKAARGTSGSLYPWGNDAPDCDIVNFNRCKGRTMPVGSFPAGVSPYGLRDMAGNIFEWCNDWYDPGYYAVSPSSNPTGPSTGSQRVHRGGSWTNDQDHLRSTDRDGAAPTHSSNRAGFRICWNE